MKLINQSAQYLPQQAGIDGIYKQIELAAEHHISVGIR